MPTPNPTSIEPDAFAILLDRSQGIADQQVEANAARRTRDERALQFTRDNMTTAQQNAVAAARSASQQSALYADSQAKLDRIDEINNDPLLWLAEPVAGLFDNNYSRPALKRQVASNAQRITIQRNQDALAAESTVAQQQAQQAELLALDMQAALESGDVDAIEKMVAQTKAAQNDALLFKQILLAKTDDKNLDRLPTFMDFTDREIQGEKNARQSEAMQIRMQSYQEIGAAFDAQQREISALTPEQLRDPQTLARLPAQFVYEERNRREMRGIADDMARRASDLETLSNQELAAKGVRRQGGQTPTSASQGIKTRVQAEEDRAIRREDQAMQRRRFADEQEDRPAEREFTAVARTLQIEQLRAQSAELALQNAATAEKYNWVIAARDNGGIYDFGDGRKLNIAQITDAIKIDEQVRAEIVVNGSIGNIAQVAVKSTVATAMRAASMQYDNRTDPNAALQQLIDTEALPDDVRQQAAIVQGHLQAMQNPRTGASMQALIGERLVESAKALSKASVDNAVATVPRSIEPIVRKYFATNTIGGGQDATLLIADAALSNTSTDRWYYDRATQAAKQFMVPSATEQNAKNMLLDQPKLTPVEMLLTALGSGTTEETLAAPIIDGAIMQAVQDTAMAAGYVDIADAVATSSPSVLENNAFSLTKVLVQIKEKHGEDKALAFRSQLLREGRASIEAAVEPTGYTMAAYNKQLFNNDATGAVYNELQMRLGSETQMRNTITPTDERIIGRRVFPDKQPLGVGRNLLDSVLNIIP